ncbi:antibiotic biosynthesis monooxygenase family protein [Amycolatopsis tolypomycina]|uniref:antibiotic biosynthesis monooxygenase family protein n=1 Tax=Amycolatopsis tolypomycina TaxID=208445 RepID=UPI0033AD2DDD
MSRVRVLLYLRGADTAQVERAYHRISTSLAGTPGLLGNELLRSPHDPAEMAVLSEWSSLEEFGVWERGPGHRASTAPLRDHQDGSRARPFAIYQVVSEYRADALS